MMLKNVQLFLLFLFFIFNEKRARVHAFKVFYENGVKTIVAMENERVPIECSAKVFHPHCKVYRPNGTVIPYTIHEVYVDGNTALCTTYFNMTSEDNGVWRCSIVSAKNSVRDAIVTDIHVRIGHRLSAIHKDIRVIYFREVTLVCTTSQHIPLKYCRFIPPNGVPFNITQDITKESAILGKYYFPEKKSLLTGDCAVTIRTTYYSDKGNWTCQAEFDDDENIYSDHIELDVDASEISILISVTIVTISLLVAAVVVSTKISRLVIGRRRTAREVDEVIEIRELGGRETATPSPQNTRPVPQIVVQSPSDSFVDPGPSTSGTRRRTPSPEIPLSSCTDIRYSSDSD